MGNKLLKIMLPLIILGVIAIVINRTQKSIDGIAPTDVDPFNFGMYINEMVQSDILNKPFSQAKEEYRRIYDIIKTEEYIEATNSSGIRQSLLPDTSFQRCYRSVFAGYWPIFERLVAGVFNVDWSSKTDQLNVIRLETEDLQQRNGSELRNDSLIRYLAYIDDYKSARNFVDKVSCSSKSKYDQIVSQKDAYKRKYPLFNNPILVTQLNGVTAKAKNNWRNSVIRNVNDVCKNNNLNDFLSEKEGCEKKITEYNSCFSNDNLSTNETTTILRNRWYELLTAAVNDACQIDNLDSLNACYKELSEKIEAYGSEANDLKGSLSRRFNELRDRENLELFLNL